MKKLILTAGVLIAIAASTTSCKITYVNVQKHIQAAAVLQPTIIQLILIGKIENALKTVVTRMQLPAVIFLVIIALIVRYNKF